MRDMLLYGLLRLALWAVIWWVLTLAGLGVVIAGVAAALIAMLISILALNRPREAAARRWKEADERRRERKGEDVDEDAQAEDALLGEEGNNEAGPVEQSGAETTGTTETGPASLPTVPDDAPDDAREQAGSTGGTGNAEVGGAAHDPDDRQDRVTPEER